MWASPEASKWNYRERLRRVFRFSFYRGGLSRAKRNRYGNRSPNWVNQMIESAATRLIDLFTREKTWDKNLRWKIIPPLNQRLRKGAVRCVCLTLGLSKALINNGFLDFPLRTFNPLVVGSNPARPTTWFVVNEFQIKGLEKSKPFFLSNRITKVDFFVSRVRQKWFSRSNQSPVIFRLSGFTFSPSLCRT